MPTGSILGLSASVASTTPCATIVVPCGIGAVRATVIGSFGLLVAGTLSHMPGLNGCHWPVGSRCQHRLLFGCKAPR